MNPGDPVFVESLRLYRFFTRGPTLVSLVDGRLRLEKPGQRAPEEVGVDRIDGIAVQSSWFRTRLTVYKSDRTRRSIGGLDRRSAVRFRDAVLETAGRYAEKLSPHLEEVGRHVDRALASRRYLKHSESRKVHQLLVSAVHQVGRLVRDRFKPGARTVLDRLAQLGDAERFEAERSKANRRFVEATVPRVKEAARSVLSYPLTEEQAKAIATDEDVTLVLAGAGTGKTATIAGKVAHLVRNEGVQPDEILVLAYNRKAAKEIRQRLPGDLSAARVSTFHAFGRSVIAASGIAPSISRLAGDRSAFAKAIEDILSEIVTDPRQPADVTNFIVYHHRPYRSAFDFKTLAEYEEWVRTVELRTLNGELVKSFEELAIANYLAEHGIRYEYESDYPVDTATRSRRQYQPDFYLPDSHIYIEHFALDEQENPPSNWKGYAEGVEWKREIHEQSGSTLVQTYSWQYSKGVLLGSLRQELEQRGVIFERIPRRVLLGRLSGQLVSGLTQLLATFLNHVKTSGLTSNELRERSRPRRDRLRCLSFLGLFEAVRERYEQVLTDERAMDFHDLINRAVLHLQESRRTPRFRYVLVDEFQDISRGRMALLEALALPNVAWFLVGDDWQSIYRFAGSDVGLVRNCGAYLGYTREQALSQTFRFGPRILGPSTAFVQRNPEQTKRPLHSSGRGDDTGITVVVSTDAARGVRRALQQIERLGGGGGERQSVLVLGRYVFSRQVLPPRRLHRSLKVRFSTVHSAKGEEADHVIVVDLKDERMGFPCRIEDDPLLDLVLPPISGEAFPFAEERCLFYVAMTRARIGTYLITDPVRPSSFVAELLNECQDIPQLGRDLAPKCARCRSGRLIRSQTGRNLRCSNYPACDYLAPRCGSCNKGYSLVVGKFGPECTNSSCGHRPKNCPRCEIGILMRRRGRYGPFRGCSRYGFEPSCEYTESITGLQSTVR